MPRLLPGTCSHIQAHTLSKSQYLCSSGVKELPFISDVFLAPIMQTSAAANKPVCIHCVLTPLQGHAVKRGMLVARGEYCLMMDADGATKFSELQKLEAQLEKVLSPSELVKYLYCFGKSNRLFRAFVYRHEARPNPESSYSQHCSVPQRLHCFSCLAALGSHSPMKATASPSGSSLPADSAGLVGVAFGSRAHLQRSAAVKRTKLRNFLMHGFHLLVVFVAGGRVRDTQCGFKVRPRSHVQGQAYSGRAEPGGFLLVGHGPSNSA